MNKNMQIGNTERGKIFTLKELREKSISNQIINLKPKDRSLELRAVVLERTESRELKSKVPLYQFLIADGTGSILTNFFGDVGKELKEGDILYLYDTYTGIYNNKMVLYQGKRAFICKIGEYFFDFKETPNVSMFDWSSYEEINKTLNKISNV